jgi:plasmid stability protein
MPNLTITLDEELLRRARVRALHQGTSVNAVLRAYLEAYVGDDGRAEARARLVALAKKARSGSGRRGRTWTRDDLHER